MGGENMTETCPACNEELVPVAFPTHSLIVFKEGWKCQGLACRAGPWYLRDHQAEKAGKKCVHECLADRCRFCYPDITGVITKVRGLGTGLSDPGQDWLEEQLNG